MADPGPLPLFFDQNDARRVEKVFSETAPLPLSQALDDRVAALSEGLDSPLMRELLVELLLSVTCSVLARLTLTSQTAACIAYKNRKQLSSQVQTFYQHVQLVDVYRWKEAYSSYSLKTLPGVYYFSHRISSLRTFGW